ncbi:MAG: hypothetical protein PHH47_08685 [Gallionella sp.]|nr:hypothetical protein [Gallionella sp.]MDD4945878.1 hypothetical protein [Gallionella sp.]MDD5612083.1 hypothetical protein [Gallionella sp.]
MKADLNFQAVSNELNVILNADINRMEAIYGVDAAAHLEQLAKDDMPVMQHMRVLYEYVVEARLPRNYPLDDALHDLTDFFLELVPNSPMIDLYRSEPIEGLCAWIVDTAVVRWGLDFEEKNSFSIKQIATLANMDERSVRNAANPKLADPLVTFRDTDGSTKVTREDAIRWLEGRRSYKKTTFIDDAGERDLAKDGFTDLKDLALFIKQQASKSAKSLDLSLQQASLQNEYTAWFGNKVHAVFDVDQFKLLATAIIAPEQQRNFILAACRVFQKTELALLEQKLHS